MYFVSIIADESSFIVCKKLTADIVLNLTDECICDENQLSNKLSNLILDKNLSDEELITICYEFAAENGFGFCFEEIEFDEQYDLPR